MCLDLLTLRRGQKQTPTFTVRRKRTLPHAEGGGERERQSGNQAPEDGPVSSAPHLWRDGKKRKREEW